MTQDERWLAQWKEVTDFMEANERRLYTWMKHNRKQMNAGKMKAERAKKFIKLLEQTERYKRKNQYE